MDPLKYFSPGDRDSVAEAMADAYANGEAEVEATIITRNDRRIRYEYRGRRMRDANGDLKGIAVIGRDISDRIRNEQRLDVAHRVLRHNLRNELNVILGWAESIEHREAHEQIVATVDHLIDMSNKTREMAALGDDPQSRRSEIDVAKTVTSILDAFRASHPHVTFEQDIPASIGSIVSRRNHLEIAIRNVVENAVEHNDADDPWVRVSVSESSDGVRIEVHDNGPGIPRTERDVLNTGIETALEHGSGVGLWLIHWCIDDLNGSVQLEERRPTGSIVRLEHPLGSAEDLIED